MTPSRRHVHRGLAAALLAAAGCTTGPVTGQTVEGSTNFQVPFTGFTDTKGAVIKAYVMTDPNADPLTAAFTQIGVGSAKTDPILFNSASTKPAFKWDVVSSPISAARWPSGGLVRLKTRSAFNGSTTPADMLTFDTYGGACLSNEIFTGNVSWLAAGQDCQSPYSGVSGNTITLVSTERTPASDDTPRYLSARGGHLPSGAEALLPPNQQDDGGLNYYNKSGAPQTLTLFKSIYGFNAGPPIRAVYYNHGDLGVARDMNCTSTTIGGAAVRACYVTNFSRHTTGKHGAGFGPSEVAPQDALAQLLGPPGALPGSANVPLATVAMVYNAGLPATQRVQFMVYGVDEQLSTQAALDNAGALAVGAQDTATTANVAVPENCLTCHGTSSSYTASAGGPATVTNAHFLPFDPAGFEFVPASTNAAFAQGPMMDRLKQLNALVMDTEPAPATLALIKGMWASPVTSPPSVNQGPKDPLATYNDAYLPPGWTLSTSEGKLAKQVYIEVVKPYCRTCHVSHDAGPADWTTFAGFKQNSTWIGSLACNNAGQVPMPQAEQTQTRFWTSAARAHLVSAFDIPGACAP